MTGDDLHFVVVDGSRAADVLEVIHEAFANRPPLDPPAPALQETEESIQRVLDAHGGMLAEHRGGPVGALIFEPRGRLLGLRRVGVVESVRGLGVAAKLAECAAEFAAEHRYGGLEIEARLELPATIAFWRKRGFVLAGRNGNRLNMIRLFSVERTLTTADQTRAYGAWLATMLRPGDLLILTGELGAGKTTLTQGIGEGLRVRGQVTSPTFVISRVHPPTDGGPPLIHVDAYRLDDAAELDDLDLDTDVEDAITVVEWGEGIAEELAPSRLELHLVRHDDDSRTLTVTPVGPRWREMVL